MSTVRRTRRRRLMWECLEQRSVLTAGDLDLAFDHDGLVTTNILPPKNEFAWDAAPTSDGDVVAVGYLFTDSPRGPDMAIARYKESSSSAGISFYLKFKTTVNLSPYDEVAMGVGLQSTGKIVVGGFATGATPGDNDFALVRLNDNGEVDTTFGTGGSVKTDFGFASDEAYDLAVQSDDSIVLVGKSSSFTTGKTDFAIARYSPDGHLLFKTTTSFGAIGGSLARGVAVFPDNSFVAVGQAVGPGGSVDFALARYSAGGALSPGFGGGGKVTTDFHGGFDIANGVVIDGAGKIVVGGNATDGSLVRMAAARYSASGGLDAGFASSGKFETAYSGAGGTVSAFANDVNLDSDGHILLAGSFGTSPATMGMARLTSGGTLDSSFNGTGLAAISFGATGTSAASAVLPNPYLDNYHKDYWVVGGANGSGTQDFAQATINSAGRTPYIYLIDFSASDEEARAVAVQSDNKILVAGVFRDPMDHGFDDDMLLVRYLEDGRLDPSFGDGGHLTLDIDGGEETPVGIVVQPDGGILVVGRLQISGHVAETFLARYLPSGRLDTAFAGGVGYARLSLFPDHDTRPAGIALQSTGKIVLAGTIPNAAAAFHTTSQFIVRYLPNGELDRPFGVNLDDDLQHPESYYNLVHYIVDQVRVSDTVIHVVGWGVSAGGITSGDVRATKLLVDDRDRILLGGELQVGGNTQMVVTRFLANGRLDNEHAGDGFEADGLDVLVWGTLVRTPLDEALGTYQYFHLESTTAVALGLQSDGDIVSLGTKQRKTGTLLTYTDTLALRVRDDGAVYRIYGASSLTDTDGPAADVVDLVMQSDDKSVAVATYGNQFWLTRYNADLTTDFDNFGTDAKVLTSFGAANKTRAMAAARTPDGKLVVVGYTEGPGVLGRDLALARYQLFEGEVVGVNHPPTVPAVLATSTTQNAPVAVDVLASASDVDHDPLTISAVAAPSHGTATITPYGVLYTPALDYYGADAFTYTISDGRGGVATGRIDVTVRDVVGPRVTQLLVSGTTWSGSPFAVPVGSGAQLLPLPWGNINQIVVRFSEDVRVDATSLSLVGLQPSYAFRDFRYDATLRQATWTLEKPLGTDQLRLGVTSVGSSAVRDASGNALDGEWTNPTATTTPTSSSFPSGNGTTGGSFLFYFQVLPGDVNRDGIVNTLDTKAVLDARKSPAYNVYFDLDHDGDVDNADHLFVTKALGQKLDMSSGVPRGPTHRPFGVCYYNSFDGSTVCVYYWL